MFPSSIVAIINLSLLSATLSQSALVFILLSSITGIGSNSEGCRRSLSTLSCTITRNTPHHTSHRIEPWAPIIEQPCLSHTHPHNKRPHTLLNICPTNNINSSHACMHNTRNNNNSHMYKYTRSRRSVYRRNRSRRLIYRRCIIC